ncbi:uncharacterized protein L3040_006438 [Drepanopeziza brunnea f. sp. 'multigermtubi']|uniref:uncharacterized protein n=1 Tax=Drepanopeziza brunnea f. sp. 'multigermtubi' TaxID=698441 RepID=UPI0023A458D7|nr:hypothetical protein L3040_006438 [Drepanopeziza brunnea f. sp. 'multigermtubi']
MSDEASPNSATPIMEAEPAHADAAVQIELKEAESSTKPVSDSSAEISESKEAEVATEDAPGGAEAENTNDTQTTSDDVTQNNPAPGEEDSKMKDTAKPDDTALAVTGPADVTVGTPASAAKNKGGNRRKSTGVPEHKGKKISKKASLSRLTHTDAKPGDYFYIRLKGYPLWPGIVCDDTMLPTTLLRNRPVTAARADGTYREDFADGGAKVNERTFPVMYLHTNEFGWIPNYDLVDLDFSTVGNVQPNMRKDLAAARTLAAEKNDLGYFKLILKQFVEQREAERSAKEAAKAEKKAAAKKSATPKKVTKSAKTVVEDDEDDVEMPDVAEPESEGAEASAEPKKTKKRKAEETPQAGDSVKKARTTIKLTTKSTNGASTPKAPKEATPKAAKPKKSKAAPKTSETPAVTVPKEPELSAEEKRAKKEKEILFLRHKLQKGLLTRDQDPKEEEMKQMSEFVSKLEGYHDLEVSIIRATKINKVLKAILKLPKIPQEDVHGFKKRSQKLLDQWNKLLASSDTTPASGSAPATNGEAKSEVEGTKASPAEATNGTKESSAESKAEEKIEEKTEEESEETAEDKVETDEKADAEKSEGGEKSSVDGSATPEAKGAPAEIEVVPAKAAEEPEEESIAEPDSVETTA